MSKQTNGPLDAPATFTASEVARATGIGLNYIYTLLRSNQLHGQKVKSVWQIDAQSVWKRWPEMAKTHESEGGRE